MLYVENILSNKNMDLWSVEPKETAYKALEIMAKKDIGSLLVIDKGKLVGIFTERDYARKVILRGNFSKKTTVEELMTRNVITVTPETSFNECMALMKVKKCRHMPVYENKQLIAMLTMRDLMDELINEKDLTIHILHQYIYGV